MSHLPWIRVVASTDIEGVSTFLAPSLPPNAYMSISEYASGESAFY